MCEEFNDDLCEEFIRCCPQLNEFKYYIFDLEKKDQYYTTLWKLRLLITELNVGLIEQAIIRQGDTLQYLTSFPRLKTINCSGNFLFLLRLLDNLKYMAAIKITSERDDEGYFVERYFETKSREEQAAIVERLSNVKGLNWNCCTGLGLHSTMFITKYLTGLESFEIVSDSNLRWTDSHTSVLCDKIVDMVLSTKKKSRISIRGMEITVLRRFLPTVMDKMFRNTTRNKRLQIMIGDELGENLVRLSLEQKQYYHEISLAVSREKSLDGIMRYLFPQKTPTLLDIDEFELVISNKKLIHYNQATNTAVYTKLLRRMPSLKKVELDIPESFDDTEPTRKAIIVIAKNYARVEELVLRGASNTRFHYLLVKCPFLFPNLKDLDLQYFCGVWNKYKNIFHVELANYSLQNLKIDMTPVKTAIKQLVETKPSMETDFFVIIVKNRNDSKRYLYKVALDLSSVTTTRKTKYGYTRWEDYVRVYISLGNAQSIDICLYPDIISEDDESNYIYYSSTKYVNLHRSTRK